MFSVALSAGQRIARSNFENEDAAKSDCFVICSFFQTEIGTDDVDFHRNMPDFLQRSFIRSSITFIKQL